MPETSSEVVPVAPEIANPSIEDRGQTPIVPETINNEVPKPHENKVEEKIEAPLPPILQPDRNSQSTEKIEAPQVSSQVVETGPRTSKLTMKAVGMMKEYFEKLRIKYSQANRSTQEQT